MQRMTEVLSRMLNDPATRAALSGGGEDSLEGVIEQEGVQAAENNSEAAAGRSNEPVEPSTEQSESPRSAMLNDRVQASCANRLQIQLDGDRDTSPDRAGDADVYETTSLERLQTREVEKPREYNHQLVSPSTSANVNNDVPMETESSQTDQAQAAESSSSSHDRTCEHNNAWSENTNEVEASCANIAEKQENMMENLHDRLTTMRDGFLERYEKKMSVL